MLILGILGYMLTLIYIYIYIIYILGKTHKPHMHSTASATTTAHQPISSL